MYIHANFWDFVPRDISQNLNSQHFVLLLHYSTIFSCVKNNCALCTGTCILHLQLNINMFSILFFMNSNTQNNIYWIIWFNIIHILKINDIECEARSHNIHFIILSYQKTVFTKSAQKLYMLQFHSVYLFH